jgi:CHAT domain-containing protein
VTQEQVLDNKTALLAYALGPKESVLWVVTRDTWNAHFLPPAAEIAKKVLAFVNSRQGTESDAVRSLAQLSQVLLPPRERLLEGRRLLILPDGVLWFVPFEALIDATDIHSGHMDLQNPDYLLRNHEIVYAPSATVLTTIRRRTITENRRWEKDFLGLAPETYAAMPALPYARLEVEMIAKLFPDGMSHVRLGSDATKTALQTEDLRRYRYLHFATHGVADTDKPQFCGLVLGAADLLHTFEILNLECDADIIVASACESGLGELMSGEGMVGLIRAFLYAGARSVVASLWRVHDESTARLMQRFYAHLKAGTMDKSEALRRAKLELIDDGWRHPYCWAPFVLIGDWR